MRIRIIDAFTDRPMGGNPAAVCLLDGDAWPDGQWMQSIAAEMNLSETAFARPLGGSRWALRWFTPATEVDLCGHATLATAHAMAADGLATGTVGFETRSGLLSATANHDGTITLDFPVNLPVAVAPLPGLAEALGVPVVSAHDTGALGDLLVELADEQTVRTLRPDLAKVAALATRGVIVTAAAADPAAGYDFVSRFFGPAVGVPEDPVTGSAHTALAPFWGARLGRDELVGLQASARTGLVGTVRRGDRVELTGRAVTVLDGTLHV
ncbi:PhzF family phenazine biosynthesis protein [Catellatospora sp. KI3]|uniref:PhzF family phenazine biosynthesis protein n=1 Tax=Catellatospora sp. KI3 TaxID=3041620 RepID=UPI0024831FEF|nr:PhzF family phenazine biosynthesis protein [Catellatospora sp. KI3]MDI1465726.1 PhzF family phenazine biosynthesis protein [Catellatospora sp. KI3]